MSKPMMILAIDPGYEVSAYVVFDGLHVLKHGIENNTIMLPILRTLLEPVGPNAVTVIEQIESFGMAVGKEVFETVFWTGRFYQVAQFFAPCTRMPRRTVKLHLCGSARAQDSNIRVALMDLFGGSKIAVGRKAQPGPLYGIKSHEWAALAIAVTYFDQTILSQQKGA